MMGFIQRVLVQLYACPTDNVAWQLYNCSKIVPLSKGQGSAVRPIAVPSVFHKIASSVAATQIFPEIQTTTHGTQHGIGLKNGSTVLVERVRALMRQHPEYAIAHLDVSNAFGCVDRHAASRVLKSISHVAAKVLQHWITSTQWAMCQRATGEYVFLATQERIPQRDPASAALFVATIQLAIDEVREKEENQHREEVQSEAEVQVLAYIDDVTVLAAPQRLPLVLDRLETTLANVGLQVNITKTQVYLHETSPMPEMDAWRALWKGTKGCHDGITSVGQPIDPDTIEWNPSISHGTPTYTQQWLHKRQLKQTQTVNKILALLDKATPDMNMMHHLWYLLQLAWNTSDVHLEKRPLRPALSASCSTERPDPPHDGDHVS